jgi:hypothetical protein
MSTTILLKSEDITKNTLMGGNIDRSTYIQDIKTCQNLKIKPFLGSDLYDKIVADYIADTLAGDYLTMFNDYIKEMIIHGSTELYLAHGAYKVTNVGITKHSTDSSETVNKEEVDFLVQSSRKLYELYKAEFLVWIADKTITEWTSTCDTARSKNVGGWRL